MRITKIELAVRLSKQNLPEYFATIHRVPGNDTLTVDDIVTGASLSVRPWLE